MNAARFPSIGWTEPQPVYFHLYYRAPHASFRQNQCKGDKLGSSSRLLELSNLLDIVNAQYCCRFGPQPLTQGRVVDERLTVGRNNFLYLGGPCPGLQFFCKQRLM